MRAADNALMEHHAAELKALSAQLEKAVELYAIRACVSDSAIKRPLRKLERGVLRYVYDKNASEEKLRCWWEGSGYTTYGGIMGRGTPEMFGGILRSQLYLCLSHRGRGGVSLAASALNCEMHVFTPGHWA